MSPGKGKMQSKMLRDIINIATAKLGHIDNVKLPSVRLVDIDPSSIGNILVIRLGRLGDAVLSTPCITALRRHFPHANITMMLASYNKVIYENNPHIDNIIVYESRTSPLCFKDKLKFRELNLLGIFGEIISVRLYDLV